jgi:hypothetical protein
MLKVLQEVFNRLRGANLKLHPKKCVFLVEKIRYLGHVLSRDGVEINMDGVKIINDFPRPATRKKLKSFLGLCSYFRKYIRGYAQITQPLRALLSPQTKYEWNAQCEQAFNLLRERLVSPPILGWADHNLPFRITADGALSSGTGYLCRRLTRPERRGSWRTGGTR